MDDDHSLTVEPRIMPDSGRAIWLISAYRCERYALCVKGVMRRLVSEFAGRPKCAPSALHSSAILLSMNV